MIPRKIQWQDGHLYLYRRGSLSFGFTTRGISGSDLREYFQGKRLRQVRQLHGDRIRYSSRLGRPLPGDGIILDESGIPAVIKTADCLPLFFWTADNALGGILHLGWRGSALNMEIRLVDILTARGISPEKLRFLMGPCICGHCYEVGPELQSRFQPPRLRPRIFQSTGRDHRYRLDLKKKTRITLLEKGVMPRSIFDSGFCTYRCRDFPSYRREKKNAGRIYNFMIRNK